MNKILTFAFSLEGIAHQSDVSSDCDTEDNFLQIGVLKCEIGWILKKLEGDLVA